MADTNVMIAALREMLAGVAPPALPDTPSGAAAMTPAKLRYFQAVSIRYGTLMDLAEEAIRREEEANGEAAGNKLRSALFDRRDVPETGGLVENPEPGPVEVDVGPAGSVYRYSR